MPSIHQSIKSPAQVNTLFGAEQLLFNWLKSQLLTLGAYGTIFLKVRVTDTIEDKGDSQIPVELAFDFPPLPCPPPTFSFLNFHTQSTKIKPTTTLSIFRVNFNPIFTKVHANVKPQLFFPGQKHWDCLLH